MDAKIFTTLNLPASQQLDAWRGWFDLFDVQVDLSRDGFQASSETWSFGRFSLSRVKAPKLLASRTAKHVRRDSIDHWNIAIGGMRTLADAGGNRSIDVPAGVPFAASLGREVTSCRDHAGLQLYFPRDAFPDLIPVLEAAEGRPLTGPLGVLLAEFLGHLGRSAPGILQSHEPGLQSAVHAMLLACFAPSPDNTVIGEAPIAIRRKAVIRRIIDQNLHCSGLTPEFLCRKAAISRSQLYRLFENGRREGVHSARTSEAVLSGAHQQHQLAVDTIDRAGSGLRRRFQLQPRIQERIRSDPIGGQAGQPVGSAFAVSPCGAG